MKKKSAKETVDHRDKDFLTEAEVKRFLEAARHGRHGVRDYLMMLMAYRHGLRVSYLVDIRLKDLDLETARLYVRREKGSLSRHQPIEGNELRAIRAWLREREQRSDARSTYLFLSEGGPMTRQAVNYLVDQIGQRTKLRFHVHPRCCGIQRDIIWRIAVTTRGWCRIIWVTKTSRIRSDIREQRRRALKDCGVSVVFCPFAKQSSIRTQGSPPDAIIA